MVRDAEPAHRSDRLRESADDEIDVVDDALCFGDAAAMLSDESHRVRFVHKDHGPVRLGDSNHLLERRDVAEHRIDPFEDDELASAFGDSLQTLLESL